MLEQSTNRSNDAAGAVKQLVEFVEKTPLEPKPNKGTFTTRQRDEALRQTALWLVARECLKQKPLREQGVKLGERALEAARRQTDSGYALAILREWGQLALEAGDRESAERRWTEMLEMVIPKPVDNPKKTSEPQARINHGPIRPNGDPKTISPSLTADRHRDGITIASARLVSRQLDRISSDHQNRLMSRWEMLLLPAIVGQAVLAVPAPAPPPARPPVREPTL